MRALDLFCGVGGASMGLHRAGFDITGVDKERQPDYPFRLIRADVLTLDPVRLSGFDLIWASPPCQAYSAMLPLVRARLAKIGAPMAERPRLIDPTRALLAAAGVPAIIENVPRAASAGAMRADVTLCGSMFGLRLVRHRAFELVGWWTFAPPHGRGCQGRVRSGEAIMPVGRSTCVSQSDVRHWRATGERVRIMTPSIEECQGALDVDWTDDRRSLNEAIPPAFSQWLAEAFLDQHVASKAAADA